MKRMSRKMRNVVSKILKEIGSLNTSTSATLKIICLASGQYGFVFGHHVMEKLQDVDITVPFSQKLLSRWSIRSLSYDKSFWSPGNFDRLKDQVENLIMHKKGKLNKAEQQRQQSKTFKTLWLQHVAVESAINCLEQPGLNRCRIKVLMVFIVIHQLVSWLTIYMSQAIF